jgi:hypothetical protein
MSCILLCIHEPSKADFYLASQLMRNPPVRCMPMRCMPLRRMPSEIHAREIHAYEMYAREVHTHEMHAHEMHELGRCREILIYPQVSIYLAVSVTPYHMLFVQWEH